VAGSRPRGDRAEEASEGEREWRWLVRHKERSVLETAGHDTAPAKEGSAPALSLPASTQLADLGPLAGSMELAATAGSGSPTDASGSGLPGGVGALRLQGQLADGIRWSLGGLIAESEGRPGARPRSS